MLRLNTVYARYNMVDHHINAVDDVSLCIGDREIFGIAGESGCGKSTLMKVMYDNVARPLEVSRGTVELLLSGPSGRTETYKTGEIRGQWWRKISYIPQGAMNVLNPLSKIKHQFFDAVSGDAPPAKALYGTIVRYLSELGLRENVMEAYPHQLSGGMRQRVLIAMATFLHPAIVLADEPTTALDVVVQKDILTMIKRVQRRLQNAMVIISHDMCVHYQITDRVGIMYAGRIIEIGETDEIFKNPVHPYTRILIQSIPRIGDLAQREGVSGLPPSLNALPPGCRFYERCPYRIEICAKVDPTMREISTGHVAACHLAAAHVGKGE